MSPDSDIEFGRVRLILLQDEDSSFHLDIPLDIIKSLCLKPLKYLLFLGWCILGVEGVLASEPDRVAVDTDGILNEREIYYYNAEDDDLTHAVDLEVIRDRTHEDSETTSTRDNFCEKLLERDPYCLWTAMNSRCCTGMHIIPHRRGSEWLQLIVENRPKHGENVTTLRDINDIRNRFIANVVMHELFDQRKIAILKTPNHILDVADVPPRKYQPHDDRDITSYPANKRYSLQWLVDFDPIGEGAILSNNLDAAFMRNTRKPKPSDLLLHYNYGAAAVRQWGNGKEFLMSRANPPRPSTPVPAPMGLSKSQHDRTITIGKRDKSSHIRGSRASKKATARAGAGEKVELEGQASWDEDDVILFCWGNTSAAKERHRKKVEETNQRMEAWRDSIPQGLTFA